MTDAEKARLMKRKPRKSDGTIYVCKCECGGQVRGVWQFGRLWTVFYKCTPVQHVNISKLKPRKGGFIP